MTSPLYYSIFELAMYRQFARPVESVSSTSLMDVINSVRREGREPVAITLDKKGMEAFAAGMGALPSDAKQIQDSPVGHVGEWYGVPVYTDQILVDNHDYLQGSFVYTGHNGLINLSTVPVELMSAVLEDLTVNVPPHIRTIDPFYDYTLNVPLIPADPPRFKDRMRAVVSAAVRSQFNDDQLSFMDSKYDVQHFNVEPIVEALFNLFIKPDPVVNVVQVPPDLPLTLVVVPNIPHEAQNLTQLLLELDYWKRIEESASTPAQVTEAYNKRISAERWISRRQAETVADQPKL